MSPRLRGPAVRRALLCVVAAALAGAAGAQAPAFAAPAKRIAPPKPVASVPGSYSKPAAAPAAAGSFTRPPATVRWPAAVSADVTLGSGDLSTAVDAEARQGTAVPGTPVRLAGAMVSGKAAALAQRAGRDPGSVRVDVLAHDAGAAAGRPVVVRLTRSDGTAATGGTVRFGLDYTAFREAYGGDWSSRLHLVSLPECALRTPDAPGCRPTDLAASNDTGTGTISATVALTGGGTGGGVASMSASTQSAAAGALVALAASPQTTNGGGDYAATQMSPTSSWSAGGQSGGFTWTYPIKTPPQISGPAPGVGIGYDSAGMDGLTAASNNQPSWAGDGFDYSPGFISRNYVSCADDGKAGVGDLCWGTDNASLTMPGHSGELLQLSTNPDVWRLRNDDGTKVERKTGATNGARNGEYWEVTTPDGWVYSFGLNRLPGWTSGKLTTQSVFTVPVFGNNGGATPEPCYNATYANAWCDQAYTWNLDYVLDPRGNTMSLWYGQETNHYGRNNTASTVSTYTRGGHIDHILYGTRKEAGTESFYTAGYAPAQVVFATAERCETPGATCVQSTPSNWPDVPWDQQCDSTSSCPNALAPSFFTQKRLASVTTQVWSGTGVTYRDVERWTLNTSFKTPGDGRPKLLWLDGIQHTGLETGPANKIDLPSVTFTPVSMGNRVDTSPTKNPIQRLRLSSLTTETGGEIAVTYSAPDCVVNTRMPASPDTNTLRCFPVYWTPYGTTTATFDWFHKYVVTAVAVTDKTGGLQPKVGSVTSYQYIGDPAWHYDDNELVPSAHKSWGQWRGYGKVRTLLGQADTPQIQTDTVYFRGMHGDKTPTGTRSVQIPADPDFGGAAINDEDWRNGMTREVIQYNGVGDTAPVVGKALQAPWESGPTVTRNRNSVVVNAYLTGVRSSTQKVALDGGRGWRTTTSTNTFDTETGLSNPIGRVVKVDDTGDTGVTGDERCTRVTYATDTGGTIRTAVAQQQVVAAPCATANPDLKTLLVADTRTWFDNAGSFDGVVSKGDATRTEQAFNDAAGNVVYRAVSVDTYDKYGRTLTTTDALGYTSSTVYTPASGSQATSIAYTNRKTWTRTDTVNPAYGNITSAVDANGRRYDLGYDALGRITDVWEPGRPKTGTPTRKYAYVVGGVTAITSTATSVLTPDGTGYNTSYQLFDGLLRKRQTQVPAVGGGVVLTDTIYDSRGLAVQSNNPYFQAGVSWGNLFTPPSPTPGRVMTTYDNAGRPTVAAYQADGVEKWRTTSAYGGDHVDTTAPAGGTGTSIWTDALGRQTQLWQFHGTAPTGVKDVTTNLYDVRGNLAQVTDNAGTQWKYTYDVRHRRTKVVDPDRGTLDFTFDDLDQQVTSSDGLGTVLTSVYDQLGRRTDLYQGTVATGTQLVHTVYDEIVKGQESTSTRYSGGRSYTTKTLEYKAGTYLPTKTSVTIPAAEGTLLAGEYQTTMTYNPNGSIATMTMPAVGGGGAGSQPAETLTYEYNSLGLATTLSGLNTYVTATAYDSFGRISATLYNNGGPKNLAQIWSYDPGTGQTLEHGVYDNDTFAVYQDSYYGYDNSGKITSVKDQTAQYGAGPDDNQCFRYDHLQRLTNAWTPSNGNCSTDPTTVAFSALGGPSPYWQAWTYDSAGNRATQKDRTAAGDTTATSTYPLPTAARPHAVTKLTTQPPTGGSTVNNYTYDTAGNTVNRNLSGAAGQVLNWDAEGRISSVTGGPGAASYVYGPDGHRLIARDTSGTTLYLGGQEVHISPTNQVTTTRFYGNGAVRTTGAGLMWVTSDPHDTGELTFNAATLAKTQRRTTPFGQLRGATVSWPTTRDFVGGIDDPTGLTQVGARPYDPLLGRFVAADPIFDEGSPVSYNGYGYADYSPLSTSDPTGMYHDQEQQSTTPEISASQDETVVEHGVKKHRRYHYRRVCKSAGGCRVGVSVWAMEKVIEDEEIIPQKGFNFEGDTDTTPGEPAGGNSQVPVTICGTNSTVILTGTDTKATVTVDLNGAETTATIDTTNTHQCRGDIGTGYHCYVTPPDPGTVGRCKAIGLAVVVSGGGSICYGQDSRGWGVWASGSSTEGAQLSAGVSDQVFWSDGDIRDQAGEFDTVEGGAWVVSGSYSWGKNVEGDRDVHSATVGYSAGKGGGAGIGKSNTWILFHHDNC
ncbi:RHS repeat-associated core domain-containing protein [Dactylosporangium sp. NPDC049742]|uniref:RHS repeat domain-containing protein n=1 Tax=Dactylosporangium sp. NPDC049742 TaxID=3154737 RepID=UPI0034263724